jgi:acyl carrier protein
MLTIEQIASAMEKADVQIDADLEQNKDAIFGDLGLDSMDIFNLFLELETITGKVVPDEEIDNINTIDDILKFYN